MTVKFDYESLTLDEVEQIEAISGRSIEDIMDAGVPRGRTFKALVFVFTRREDASYTMEQAGKVTLKDVQKLIAAADGEEEDPKVS